MLQFDFLTILLLTFVVFIEVLVGSFILIFFAIKVYFALYEKTIHRTLENSVRSG